ncbi:MAG: hypothetical protein WC998_09105 [Candidatus Paceibacterota bacterium]
MAHYESWLAEQAIVTTAGASTVRASRIVLEINGEPHATWGIDTKELPEVARVAIVQLGESLPRGNHQARMLALDDAGQTLAVLPVVVRGTNTVATSQVDGNVQMQRAVTVLVGNVEAICTTMQSHLDLVSKGYQESLSQTMLLTDTLQGLVAAKSEQTALAEERLARSRRMDLLFEKFMPMLELGFGIVAAEVERRYSDRNKLPNKQEAPPPTPPPAPPTPPPPAAAPERPSPAVVDLASFDAQRSKGGSARGRKPPKTPAPKRRR